MLKLSLANCGEGVQRGRQTSGYIVTGKHPCVSRLDRLQQQCIQADILQEREALSIFNPVRSFVCVRVCYILERQFQLQFIAIHVVALQMTVAALTYNQIRYQSRLAYSCISEPAEHLLVEPMMCGVLEHYA